MFRKIKVNFFNVCIHRESGNLYVKDEFKISRPLLFAAYGLDNELLTLRDYMNIKNSDLKTAVKMLGECGAVLVGHCFNIYFYDEEAVNRFEKITEK